MSDFREGDLVEVTKGEESHKGRVEIDGFPVLPGFKYSLTSAEDLGGYTVTLIERAKADLPTEPGLYEDGDGELWRFDGALWRMYDGLAGALLPQHVEAARPFTRLEPVPVTAKRFVTALATKVDAAIESRPTWYTKGTAGDIVQFAREIATDYGAEL